MTFILPDLPYTTDALEPIIDQKTMELHHGKHHQAYVNNLNNAVKDTEFAEMDIIELLQSLESVSKDKRQAVRNNGGGHLNHSLFWEQMVTPNKQTDMPIPLKEKLTDAFGSVEAFQEAFEKAGAARFGSGWVWLVDNNGKLEIHSYPNQDNPIMDGLKPILGNDVWEHAYYLNYHNVRGDYLKAYWKLVNWDVINERLS